jgi:alpha-D-xyloside xylohydrolase
MLVAPLFEDGTSRYVYLPVGKWFDYQTGKIYEKGWNEITVGQIPAVIMIRDGAIIPHIALAQSTDKMDWSNITLRTYLSDVSTATGLFCLPSDNKIIQLTGNRIDNNNFNLTTPTPAKVSFKVDLQK